MMRTCVLALALASVLTVSGKEKEQKPAESHYRNDEIEVTAKLYTDKTAIQDLVGSDLGSFIVIVEVTVAPKTEKPLKVYGDDFTLLSNNDGQKSQPFAPSQIAGRGALVVTQRGARGAMMGENRGPVWGGMGGPMGQLGGQGGGIGNAPGQTETQTTMKSGIDEKEPELLSVLKKKAMPEGEIEKPVKGLLYFPLEGKHKVKDLELIYKGPAGRFSMRFKP
jgi:hypothetical protein